MKENKGILIINKTYNVLVRYWFIFVFALVIALPLYGINLDNKIELSGVEDEIENVTLNMHNLGDGSYQDYLNSKWEKTMPGRKYLINVRNQLLYSLFNVSPNTNVIVGKDKYLFTDQYIDFEVQYYAPSSKEYFAALGSNLALIQNVLKQYNKELYVFITPSKANIYRQYIPDNYLALSKEYLYDYTNIEALKETLDLNHINYFSSPDYLHEVDENKYSAPFFYKSGIHWSKPWGEECASQFLKMMNNHSSYSFPELSINEYVSDKPLYPDSDLYDTLNLMEDNDETYYGTEIKVSNEEEVKPNVFIRGGSFLGHSLDALVRANLFNEDVHFENNYYFLNNYSYLKELSSFTAYDEVDNLDYLLGKSDILILEVNEASIYAMDWGFIELLVNNLQYLDRNYSEVI